MDRRHGFVLMASWIFLSAFGFSEAFPLLNPHKTDGSTGDNLTASLFLTLVVSFTVLVVLVLVLVNCVTCCKEREIDFKEFEDHFDDEIDFTPPAEDTPSMQSPAEVYTLAVSPVPLPGPPHLQPLSNITEASNGFKIGRHSLSYIQEIGNGWFGQVLLSEIYTDPGGPRVVVKELKANASAKEQNDFLQQGDPFRVLQHPNILHCLGQCTEAIPFLLVFEYCEMGDLRIFLSQQDWTLRSADLLQLQRMACEIAAGVTHLHKHNFLHSDLALRNCYLTADLTVKVGDYGIGPYRYKEDYIITEDDVFAPLRWLAPELVAERHGGVISLEQTKASNVWALGVTLWELLESAAQPYPHLSDREVLHHVIKEQQIKLFKPQLELPYSDRWYEVLQFCWLSPEKRATAEEVHRLLVYLRMQGQKDMEEDFEQRWDALKPNPTSRQTVSHSSFPILDQFADDALRQEIDEVLTVTETSKGLSFEYVWEAAKHDHYDGNHGLSGMDTTLNYQSMFFPASREDIQANFPDLSSREGRAESSNLPPGISGIVPVFDAQTFSDGSKYYIQLEEQGESNDGEYENQEVDFTSGQKDFVVLQDVHLDESSTDADFFHQSIDSKDSYLPDSHIWSSLENDSPYHTNIFTEEGSKHEDSPPWRQNLLELPERNGNPFLERSSVMQEVRPKPSYDNSFLGGNSHSSVTMDRERENVDVERVLNAEKLSENFMFLREHNLVKDSTFPNLQQSFLLPGIVHEPEEAFKMNSWGNLESSGSSNATDSHLNPPGSGISSRNELSHSPVMNSDQSLIENKITVPSISVIADDYQSSMLPVKCGSSIDDLSLLQSSDRDSGFDTTSERVVAINNHTNSHNLLFSDSAITDSLSTDAKISSLEEDLETSKFIGNDMLENHKVQAFSAEMEQNEDLTSNDMLSELIEDADLDLETNLSDQEESLTENNGNPFIRTSLLISGPSLDQISQDSLLEDGVSTTVPTLDNSAETPDSPDSLYIQGLGEQMEELNVKMAHHKLHPPQKISDSGYDTENLESPEWSSQPNAITCSPVKNGISSCRGDEFEEITTSVSLVTPKIVISEVEGASVCEDVNEGHQPDREAPAEEPSIGSNYRDSAYFSDNESDPEKKSEETTVADDTWLSNTEGSAPESSDSVLLQPQSSVGADAHTEVGGTAFTHVELLPESFLDEETQAPINRHEDEQKSETIKDSLTDQFSPSEDLESSNPWFHTPEIPVHAKLTRTYANDGHKIKEPDVEGRYLGRREGTGLEGQEDGVDADEEDENSDESDEDMLHSSSEDSEDEVMHAVPIIVSDSSSSNNLKSLLKPKDLNIRTSPSLVKISAENSKRAVSFFDDVTVYLFDQETPTKELGDHSAGLSSQAPEFSSPVSTSSYLNRFANSESSTDEEGGGFEWDDDFTSHAHGFITSKTDKDPVSKVTPPTAPSVGHITEPSWSSSSTYSRFSISPASIASFSLTHLTDSDIEQGGSSEDGEKD